MADDVYLVKAKATILMDDEPSTPHVMEWRFDPRNPLAVSLHIEGDNIWTFSRDLLMEAVEGFPAGLGDVTFVTAGTLLKMRVDPGGGEHAVLVFNLKEVKTFVKGTYRRVPRAKESIADDRYDRFLRLVVEHQYASMREFEELAKDV